MAVPQPREMRLGRHILVAGMERVLVAVVWTVRGEPHWAHLRMFLCGKDRPSKDLLTPMGGPTSFTVVQARMVL